MVCVLKVSSKKNVLLWDWIATLHRACARFARNDVVIFVFIIISFTSPALTRETAPLLPDKNLTPGEIINTDVNVICQPGYSKRMRKTSRKLKQSIYDKS